MHGMAAQWEDLLRERFGVTGFRPGQRRAVETLMRGRDLVAVFPTGAGKSLCYQLPALLLPGLTVVVSPLIALMRDQTAHLAALGIPAVCLDSLQTPEAFRASLEEAASGRARLVYVSPERLETPAFRALVRERPLSLLVVDEAHCVLQWGESFRPAYGRIGAFLGRLTPRPPVCAMTATLDRRMRRALCASIGLRRPRILTLPLVRENLCYTVRTTVDPGREVMRMVQSHPGERGLIFCRRKVRCEDLAAELRRAGIRAAFYHAGMERSERDREQARFTRGEILVLVCTSAFGMGVDIPDIRFALHERLPDNLTDLAQQSGRAGRDGKPADCGILLDPSDVVRKNLHFQALRQEMGRTSLLHPVRKVRLWQRFLRERRETRELLEVLLTGRCIPQGIARAFGQRTAPCGICSACRRAAAMGSRTALARVPWVADVGGTDIRLWVLRWQRDAIAARDGLPPEQVMGEEAMLRVARSGKLLPRDCHPRAFEALNRLTERMEQWEENPGEFRCFDETSNGEGQT